MGAETIPVRVPAAPLRTFGDEGVQAQLERLLAALPESRRGAVLDVGADHNGIVAIAAVKLEDGWSCIGRVERRYSGEWSGNVQVRWAG